MTDDMKARFENGYPLLGSLAGLILSLGVWLRLPDWHRPFIEGAVRLFPAALNVGAISTGFLATSLSILLSLSGSRVFQKLRKAGHDVRLINFFSRALAISFAWSLMSAAMTALDFKAGGVWREAAGFIWIWAGIGAVLCYLRASQMLTAVLLARSADKERPASRRPDNGPSQDIEILV